MIVSKITYKDGTTEQREFPTWAACSKFMVDQIGTISEMNNVEIGAGKIKHGRNR